ncbi:thioredoxin-like protein [Podospora fimiseda]|uniref:Thioredoxin-like protein n=1 Tax=Podospora fimiseda TaxID=252190 RepID=A0AAN7BQ58_9PEZI|nr:thioredoxin-like protein [Podospora fimiseda]
MGGTIHIDSAAQWRQILTANAVVIADFYADWCGPCKMIAPHYEGLAGKYSKPNKIAFVKVNVDNQQAIAQQYGVRAMPTFLVFNNSSVIDTIQGANPPGLTAAVEKAIKLAGAGARGGSSFGTAGQRLGGAPLGGQRVGGNGSVARPVRWDLNNLINMIWSFFGLYFASLFSLDPYKAAENSSFNKHNPPPKTPATGPGAKKPTARSAFKTLSDLGNE